VIFKTHECSSTPNLLLPWFLQYLAILPNGFPYFIFPKPLKFVAIFSYFLKYTLWKGGVKEDITGQA